MKLLFSPVSRYVKQPSSSAPTGPSSLPTVFSSWQDSSAYGQRLSSGLAQPFLERLYPSASPSVPVALRQSWHVLPRSFCDASGRSLLSLGLPLGDDLGVRVGNPFQRELQLPARYGLLPV